MGNERIGTVFTGEMSYRIGEDRGKERIGKRGTKIAVHSQCPNENQ